MVISALLSLLSALCDDIAYLSKASFQPHLVSPTLICIDALQFGDRQLFVLE